MHGLSFRKFELLFVFSYDTIPVAPSSSSLRVVGAARHVHVHSRRSSFLLSLFFCFQLVARQSNYQMKRPRKNGAKDRMIMLSTNLGRVVAWIVFCAQIIMTNTGEASSRPMTQPLRHSLFVIRYSSPVAGRRSLVARRCCIIDGENCRSVARIATMKDISMATTRMENKNVV